MINRTIIIVVTYIMLIGTHRDCFYLLSLLDFWVDFRFFCLFLASPKFCRFRLKFRLDFILWFSFSPSWSGYTAPLYKFNVLTNCNNWFQFWCSTDLFIIKMSLYARIKVQAYSGIFSPGIYFVLPPITILSRYA